MDKEWNKMKVVDLKKFAKGKIPGYTMMNKERLVAALVKAKLPLPGAASAGAASGGAGTAVAPVAPAPAPKVKKIKKIKKTIKYAKALVKAEAEMPEAKKMTVLKQAKMLPEVLATKVGEFVRPEVPVRLPHDLMVEFGKALTYLKDASKSGFLEKGEKEVIQREFLTLKEMAIQLTQLFDGRRDFVVIHAGRWDRKSVLEGVTTARKEKISKTSEIKPLPVEPFFAYLLLENYPSVATILRQNLYRQSPVEKWANNIVDPYDLDFTSIREEYTVRDYSNHLLHALNEIDDEVITKYLQPMGSFTESSFEKLQKWYREEVDDIFENFEDAYREEHEISSKKKLSEEVKERLMKEAIIEFQRVIGGQSNESIKGDLKRRGIETVFAFLLKPNPKKNLIDTGGAEVDSDTDSESDVD